MNISPLTMASQCTTCHGRGQPNYCFSTFGPHVMRRKGDGEAMCTGTGYSRPLPPAPFGLPKAWGTFPALPPSTMPQMPSWMIPSSSAPSGLPPASHSSAYPVIPSASALQEISPTPQPVFTPLEVCDRDPPPVVHQGITCDACNKTVTGIRRKCLDCPGRFCLRFGVFVVSHPIP